MENEKKTIYVRKGSYEKDGKTYSKYFVRGIVRGVDLEAGIVPPDVGGYRVLDVVYGNEMEAELILTPYEIKDDTGRTITGNTYAVRTVDEDGVVYECKVRPARESDKNILQMLLR